MMLIQEFFTKRLIDNNLMPIWKSFKMQITFKETIYMGHSLTSTQTYLAMQLQNENTNENIFIEI